MPEITEQELKRQLAEGSPAPLYLLWGEEKFLLGRTARRLIRRTGGEEFPEFNRGEFSGEAPVESIGDAVLALPFFAEHKCVAVADFNVEEKPKEELDKLYELLDSLPETTSLILWYPTLSFDGQKSPKWKKLLQTAAKVGCTLSYSPREPQELRRVLCREAERLGCALPKESCERLLEYCGTGLTLLVNELEKLCAYTLGRGEKEILPQYVEELTPKSTETTVFLMVNALTANQPEKAYSLLDALFYQNEDPIAILGAMASAYLDMYRVKAALESGLTSSAPAEYEPIYKRLGFRLRNAERCARGMTARDVMASLNLILEADLALKGSKLDPRLVLEGLMAKLFLTAARQRRRRG